MPYHAIFERIRKVLDSCKNKQQLRIGEDYCFRLINKNFPNFHPDPKKDKRSELVMYLEGISDWKERFWK